MARLWIRGRLVALGVDQFWRRLNRLFSPEQIDTNATCNCMQSSKKPYDAKGKDWPVKNLISAS